MKIGALSDTHIHNIKNLPGEIVDKLTGTDIIVHAGDCIDKRLLNELRKLGEFKGVYRNMDPPEIKSELPAGKVFEVVRFKIGFTHLARGGAPFRLEQRVRKMFTQVDVIIYGYSHWTKNEKRDRILYFNRGSATGLFLAKNRSYGILKIKKGVEAKIIRI